MVGPPLEIWMIQPAAAPPEKLSPEVELGIALRFLEPIMLTALALLSSTGNIVSLSYAPVQWFAWTMVILA